MEIFKGVVYIIAFKTSPQAAFTRVIIIIFRLGISRFVQYYFRAEAKVAVHKVGDCHEATPLLVHGMISLSSATLALS